VLVWHARSRSSAESIVVLARLNMTVVPSPVLRARLDHAIELWIVIWHICDLTEEEDSGDTTSEAAVVVLCKSVANPRRGHPSRDEGRTTQASLVAVSRNAKPAQNENCNPCKRPVSYASALDIEPAFGVYGVHFTNAHKSISPTAKSGGIHAK